MKHTSKFSKEIKIGILATIALILTISASIFISKALYEENGKIIEPQINSDFKLVKYVNYQEAGQEKTMVEFNLKGKVSYNEGYYSPVKENSIYVKLPEIAGNLPEKIEVISVSSKATNGENKQKQAQYDYNPENRNLHIYENNKTDENGNLYYGNSNDYDEYEIIVQYNNKIELADENVFNIPVLVKYDSTNEQIGTMQQIFTNEVELKEKGDIVSSEITTHEIYNGYINSNIANETQYETEFSEETTISVSELNTDEIIVNEQNGFKTTTEEKMEQSDDIIYKQMKINRQDILRVLGENGFLQILDEEGNILLEVNQENSLEEEEIVFNFVEEQNDLTIKTSKPVNKGLIRISTTKAIKPDRKDIHNKEVATAQKITGNKINKIIKREGIKEVEEIQTELETKKVIENETTAYTEIRNAKTQVNVTLDNKDWTNSISNNVNITATLVTSKNEYNLFKNPSLEIELPEQVEKVILGDSYLLNANGLYLEDVNVVDKENGKKAIIANLGGNQTEYLFDNMIEGTNVVIPATIILEKGFVSHTNKININYNNEVGNQIEKGTSEIIVNLQSIIENKIEETSDNGNDKIDDTNSQETNESYVSSAASEIPQVEEIKQNNGLTVDIVAKVGNEVVARAGTDDKNIVQNGIVYERQIIKYQVTVTNHTDQELTNLSVIGSIPNYANYATVEKGKTWSEELQQWVSNIQDDLVYQYVIDEEVTSHELENIRTLKPGETISDWYEVKLKDLEDNLDAANIANSVQVKIGNEEYATYELSNNLQQAKVEIKLKAQATTNREDSFAYKMDIINLTDEELTNIYVETSELPKELQYQTSSVMYSENASGNGVIEDNKFKVTIDKIRARTEKEKEKGQEIYVSIWINFLGTNYEEKVNEVDLRMTAKAVTNDTTYWSNENRIKAYPQYVTAVMNLDKEGQEVRHEEELTYTVTVKNESKVKSFINIVGNLPKEIEGIEATYLYYDVGDDTTTKYDIEAETNTKYELVEGKIDLSLKSIPKQKATNSEGNTSGSEDEKPEITVPTDDIYIPTILPAGKTLKLVIKAKAGYVDQDVEVSNFITVYGNAIPTVTSNITKVKILTDVNWDYINGEDPDEPDTPEEPDAPDEPDNPDDPDDPDDPDNPDKPDKPDEPNKPDKPDDPNKPVDPDKPDEPNDPNKPVNPENPSKPGESSTYSISGTVWLDENEDGRRIESEKRLTGVTVKLFNAETNSIVTIDHSKVTTQVDSNGEYIFSKIPKGKYYCLFEYDTEKYDITSYQKSGVSAASNNDASKAKVNIDGIAKTVGITDVLVIDNSNLTNIDLGLKESKIFDLKLEKNISKVKVNNSKGKKEYKFNNTSLAKVDIPAKNMEGSVVTIEYQFVITNEGNIAGYANEITDYIPKELTFDQKNNGSWTLTNNGYVKNTSLTSTSIAPGESKTLTLYLTKTMTKSSTGIIKNSAEITKSSNVKNTKDIDSTAGNKVSGEDDYDSADILISVKTGFYRNTIIILTLIIAFLLMIYFIRKHKIKNIKKIPTMFITIFMLCMMGTNISNGWWEDISWEGANGNLSNGWWCTWEGAHQCAVATHTYWCTMTTNVKENKTETVKNISLKKESTSKSFSYLDASYNLVGPYTVTASHSIKSSDITASLSGSGSYTVCDSSGNSKSWTSGTTFSFYLKVPKTVTAVTSVTVSVTIADVIKSTYKVEYNYSATCKSVSGQHQNGRNENVSISAGACQTAGKSYEDDDTSYSDGSKSVTFGAVYAGSLIIRKYDAERKNTEGGAYQLTKNCGALFTVKDSAGHTIATGVKPKTTLRGLPPDTYTVTETSAPEGYKLDLQSPTSKSAVVRGGLSEPTTVEFSFYNQKYTNLLIQKIDATSKDTIEGIGFTVYDNKHQTYIDGSGGQSSTPVILYTDANGQISIQNIKLYDESASSTFTITEADSKNLYYKADSSKTKTVRGKSNATTEHVIAKLSNKKPYEITVEKEDKYTKEAINATFHIQYEDGTWLTSEGEYSDTKSDISTPGGSVTIKGIKRGTYHVYEVGIEESYILEMQDGYDAVNKWVDCGEVVVDDNNEKVSVKYYNKRLINIEIKKEDSDDNSAIEGMGFTVYDNYKKQYVDASGQHTSDPVIHYTDANGLIKIENIIVYSGDTTYTIKEVASKNLYYKADDTIQTTLSWRPEDSTNWIRTTIENTKSYSLTVDKIDPDKTTEKLTAYFYIQYEDGTWLTQTGEYSQTQSSITVNQSITIPKIKRGRYHIYEYKTPVGYDITQQNVYGGDSAHPTWVDCGISYVGINTSGEQDNSVCEVTLTKDNKKYISHISGYVWLENRNGKANAFDYLYGAGDEKLSGIKVEFVKKDGTVLQTTTTGSDGSYNFTFYQQVLYWDLQDYMVRFSYDNETYTTVPVNLDVATTNGSRAMESRDWRADSLATGSGTATTIPNAATLEDSIAKYYNINNYSIETLNLGLMKKPNEEFSIIENLDYVQLVKGGYTFKYEYGKAAVVQDVPEREYIYNTVAMQTPIGFTQKLYPSDIAYNNDIDRKDDFEVYVMYKITITNTLNINIEDLYVEKSLNITSLANSYNADLYEISDTNWQDTERGKAKYNQSISPIAVGGKTDVFVRFKVKDTSLQEIIQGAKLNPEIYKEAVTVAIADGYHTYDRNDYSWTYSPNTYKQRNEHRTKGETRESGALSLKLKLAEQRIISGTVFEDTQTSQSAAKGTRVGNGLYDTNENNLKAVKVSLLNKSDESVASLYSTEKEDYLKKNADGIWEFTKQEATVDVKDNGTYELIGVIPGEYYLRFTYNNGTQIVTDTSGRPIDLMDYKSTILTGQAANDTESSWYLDIMGGNHSMATDKYYVDRDGNSSNIIEMRTNSDKEINYSSKNSFNEGNIQALSANMNIQFEYLREQSKDYDYNFKNNCSGMCFGIIERPRVEIKLEKEISNVKLTLNNGTTIINGDPRDQNVSPYLVSMNDSYAKIEMENNSLYSSTVDVTYNLTATNDSEIDYASEDYYRKGIKGAETPVKTTVTKIIDYLSYQKCNYIDKSGNVRFGTADDYNKIDYFESGVIDYNSQYKDQLLVMSEEQLLPSRAGMGENKANYTVTVSRLLSNLDDDLGWESYSEIIGLKNLTFTAQYTSHSGNYKAGDEVRYPTGTSEDDNADSTIAITPSTGGNRSYTIYIVAGTVLIVLASGVIIIKKFVL